MVTLSRLIIMSEVKVHFEISSGFNSATYGAKIVPNLAGILHTPKLVAIIDTGNSFIFPRYERLKT